MKKKIAAVFFIFLFLVCLESASAQEVIELQAQEVMDLKSNAVEMILSDENITNPNEVIKKTSIEVNKPLLEDSLHFDFKQGPIQDITLFGAYQGNMSSNFYQDGYSTEYTTGFADIGAVGKFKELPVEFKIMANTRQLEGISYLEGFLSDNYISINSIPHHKIIVGNSRTAIGVEGANSSYTLPLASRAQISRNFGSIRALGVKVIGDYDLIEYNLSVTSSARFFRSFFPGGEFSGWVNLKPLAKTNGKYGKLIVGGGLNAGRNDTNYTVGGAYISYNYKKFTSNFECALADGYNGFDVSTNKASGFYSTILYDLTDKLQLVARYDQFDPNRDISNNNTTEYTAGLNYFIKGNALRVILNYVFSKDELKENSNRIFLGTQILL